MDEAKKNNSNRINNLIAVVIFVIMAIGMVLPLIHTGKIAIDIDWWFHSSRVEQIYRNLKAGVPFTYIATSTFGKTGVGSFLFYPDAFMYIWALLRFIYSPVTAYYLWVGIIFFMTLTVSYFCMQSYAHRPLRSFIFAVLYTVAPYHLYLSPVNWVLGEFVAYAFLPLAFLGIYKILVGDARQWYLLACGIGLIFYCHILSVLLTGEIMAAFLIYRIIKEKGMELERWLALVKAGIVALILALPIIIPLITDFFGKGITGTYSGVRIVQQLGTITTDSIGNVATSGSIGLVLLLVILTGWKWVDHKSLEMPMYIAAVALLILASSVFPWESFNHTPLTILQLPVRYLSYSILFAAVVGSQGIVKILDTHFAFARAKVPVLMMAILAVAGTMSYFGSILPMTTKLQNRQINKPLMLNKLNPGQHQVLMNKVVTNANYQDQFAYWGSTGTADYYPTTVLKHGHFFDYTVSQPQQALTQDKPLNDLLLRKAYLNGKSLVVDPVADPNRLTYGIDLKHQSRVDLPVICYVHTTVKVNGQKVTPHLSSRGTVELNLAPGSYKVEVGYQPSKAYFIGLGIALISWVLMLIRVIFRRKIDHRAKH